MRFALKMAVASWLLIAFAGAADGQSNAQTKFEPASGPGAGQRLLETFAGQWSVVKTLTHGPGLRCA